MDNEDPEDPRIKRTWRNFSKRMDRKRSDKEASTWKRMWNWQAIYDLQLGDHLKAKRFFIITKMQVNNFN